MVFRRNCRLLQLPEDLRQLLLRLVELNPALV